MTKSLKAYVSGAVVAAGFIVALLLWFSAKEKDLPVNQSPKSFALISDMEKNGVPDFELKSLDGKSVKLSDFHGKVVVVNFWASWCNPCVEEFPSMLKLVDAMKGQLEIIAVSADEDQKDVESFAKAFGLPKPNFYIVWEKEKTTMQKYGVEKIPESFLVGKDGKLIRKVLGIENWASPSAIEYFTELTNKP